LVTVITVTFNSEKYIKDTIESVLCQTYPYIEHIIVDGQSTDSTLAIASRYPSVNLYSEPDDGIYDAMNKGISLSTGDIIGFLNSDDFFVDENSISLIVEKFNLCRPDIVISGICYVKESDKTRIVRSWPAVSYTPKFFLNGETPPHPGFYATRTCYSLYGSFDVKYKLASDFDLMFRFLQVFKAKSVIVPFPTVHMRLGGATNSSFRHIIRGNLEIFSSMRSNGFSYSQALRYFLRKVFKKFAQF